MSTFPKSKLESAQVYDERKTVEEEYDDLSELQDEEARYEAKSSSEK